jgi:hypothetical protein
VVRVRLLDLPRYAGRAGGTRQVDLPAAPKALRGTRRDLGRGGLALGRHRRAEGRGQGAPHLPRRDPQLPALLPRPPRRTLRLGAGGDRPRSRRGGTVAGRAPRAIRDGARDPARRAERARDGQPRVLLLRNPAYVDALPAGEQAECDVPGQEEIDGSAWRAEQRAAGAAEACTSATNPREQAAGLRGLPRRPRPRPARAP